jgi:hypothetical protein
MPTREVYIYVQRGPQRLGPYAVEQLCAFARENRILPTDPAWHEGLHEWMPLAKLLARRGVTYPWLRDRSHEWLVPVNCSLWSFAAGYVGLISVLIVPAPFAVGLGVLALRDLRRHPEKRGRGRAWFAIVLGGAVTAAVAGALLLRAFQT